MLLWRSGNIEVRVWPLDHCPPHVTAVCRADNWEARFEFSMVSDDVSVWSITPKSNAPSKSVIDAIAQDVHQRRAQCRAAWWKYQQHGHGVCLDNAPVSRTPSGAVVLWDPLSGKSPAGTIMPRTGIYLAGHGVRADVNWGSQVTTELLKEV